MDLQPFMDAVVAQARGQTVLEIVASVSGALCVALLAQRNIWGWPLGLINSVLFVWLFAKAALYPDAVLSVYFTVTGVMGWLAWARRGPQGNELPVIWAPTGAFVACLVAVGLFTAALGLFLIHGLNPTVQALGLSPVPDAAFPYPESAIFALSLLAQYWLTRKVLQAWMLWIAVDLIAIPVYFAKELYLVGALYVLFLVLATAGLVDWWHAWLRQRVAIA